MIVGSSVTHCVIVSQQQLHLFATCRSIGWSPSFKYSGHLLKYTNYSTIINLHNKLSHTHCVRCPAQFAYHLYGSEQTCINTTLWCSMQRFDVCCWVDIGVQKSWCCRRSPADATWLLVVERVTGPNRFHVSIIECVCWYANGCWGEAGLLRRYWIRETFQIDDRVHARVCELVVAKAKQVFTGHRIKIWEFAWIACLLLVGMFQLF